MLSEAGETLAIEERSAPEADAKITGSERAWVEALGPDTDRVELDIQGDQRLADALLDGLSASRARARSRVGLAERSVSTEDASATAAACE